MSERTQWEEVPDVVSISDEAVLSDKMYGIIMQTICIDDLPIERQDYIYSVLRTYDRLRHDSKPGGFYGGMDIVSEQH